MTHLHLTIVVEVYNGTRIKQAMNPFKNAKFWSNESHWEWATKPNPRERLLLSENILPMQESGLNFIKRPEVSGAIRTRIRNFLLMVILISR
jgi:hypothetical protein